jgi:alkanesulfonate monooxygenase SsuD/methylene tetrahydromethanopterin reductase-like flavin-dependent oxidoreductase (luciferase family)
MAASPPAVQSAIGVEEGRIQAIRTAYAAGGAMAAGAFVSREDIDKLAIVGTPDQCAVTVRRLVQRGIRQLVILLYSQDLAENEVTLRRFASDVIPQV